jgi:hypothetical protein
MYCADLHKLFTCSICQKTGTIYLFKSHTFEKHFKDDRGNDRVVAEDGLICSCKGRVSFSGNRESCFICKKGK